MAFTSFNSRVAEHRTRFVCLGVTPSPRVRCRLALFTYLLTYCRPVRLHGKRKANGTVANSKAGGAGPDSRHTELARGSFRTRGRRRAVYSTARVC